MIEPHSTETYCCPSFGSLYERLTEIDAKYLFPFFLSFRFLYLGNLIELVSHLTIALLNRTQPSTMKIIDTLACFKSRYKLKDWEKLESLLFIDHVIQPMYSVDDDDQKGVLT